MGHAPPTLGNHIEKENQESIFLAKGELAGIMF